MSMKLLWIIKETTEKLERLTSETRFKTPNFGPRLDGIVTWSIWWRWRSVAYMHQVQYMNTMSSKFIPFQLFPIHHFRFFSRTNRPHNSTILIQDTPCSQRALRALEWNQSQPSPPDRHSTKLAKGCPKIGSYWQTSPLHFQANYETSFPAIQKTRGHCHDSLNFYVFGEHTIVVEKWQY